VFDRDLDFTNEYQVLTGDPGRLTPTGLRDNVHPIGAPLVWSPFYLAAHVYILMRYGRSVADGYGDPYFRSVVLGSVTAAYFGAVLLLTCLARRVGWPLALVAGLGVLASPVLYYIFVVPGMSHAVTFAAASALLWAWDRAERAPSLGAWLLLGSALGFVTISRWQGLVYVLLVGPLALKGLMRRSVRPAWVVSGAVVALFVFSPQIWVWKRLYGRFLVNPHGWGYVDWSSPYFWNRLISADHGLFSWTPAMLGIAGLALSLRRWPLLSSGGLLVFLATAWLNGGVTNWGDSFGGRGFDLIVPLVVIGLSVLLERTAAVVADRPLLVPAAVLVVLGLWNVGLIGLYQDSRYPHAAPLERLAGDQVRQLRLALEDRARFLGNWAPSLIYKVLVAEYLDKKAGRSISVGNLDDRELGGGWSPRRRPPGEPGFRWALPPVSCLRVALEEPLDLQVRITARAPKRCQPQSVDLLSNGQKVASAPVPVEWTEIPFVVASRFLVPGENVLCLRFEKVEPGEADESVAAAVAQVRLGR
jgi:hypothetical protein